MESVFEYIEVFILVFTVSLFWAILMVTPWILFYKLLFFVLSHVSEKDRVKKVMGKFQKKQVILRGIAFGVGLVISYVAYQTFPGNNCPPTGLCDGYNAFGILFLIVLKWIGCVFYTVLFFGYLVSALFKRNFRGLNVVLGCLAIMGVSNMIIALWIFSESEKF